MTAFELAHVWQHPPVLLRSGLRSCSFFPNPEFGTRSRYGKRQGGADVCGRRYAVAATNSAGAGELSPWSERWSAPRGPPAAPDLRVRNTWPTQVEVRPRERGGWFTQICGGTKCIFVFLVRVRPNSLF